MRSSSPVDSAPRSGFACVEVDVAAIRRNVATLRSVASPARFAAVVKGNAYGHGLAGVARALAHDVDLFCVYRAAEGYAIRDAGVQTPVLVLGPVAPAELASAHRAGLAITLWDAGSYRSDVSRAAASVGRPFPVHAEVDTGVTRLGLYPDTTAEAIAEYLGDAGLRLEGVFTHLAAVEELESDFTRGQLRRFEEALAPLGPDLRRRGILRHAAASAATLLFPSLRLDLVRVGIATYGLWPSPQTRGALAQPVELEPALAWRSELVAVRDVPTGTSVGYGCTYRTERAARIGVLPIGYAEGIPRAASNRGAILVHGTRVPIVGRVCMNMTMVDVTDVPHAHAGSAVTLIGGDGRERIDAEDWAGWAATIAYEIVTRIPAEVPRVHRDGDGTVR